MIACPTVGCRPVQGAGRRFFSGWPLWAASCLSLVRAAEPAVRDHWLELQPGRGAGPSAPVTTQAAPPGQEWPHAGLTAQAAPDPWDGDPQSVIPLAVLDRTQREIAAAGMDRVPWLIELLEQPGGLYAAPAAVRLAQLGTRTSRQALRQSLAATRRPLRSFEQETRRVELREAIVRSLSRFDPEAEDRLYLPLLSDHQEADSVRALAAVWAGLVADPDSLGPLRALLRDPGSPFTEYAVAWALARLEDPVGWHYLQRALSRPDNDPSALWAAGGLGSMRRPFEALSLLYPLLERGEPLRRQALVSIGGYTPEDNEAYLRSLPDDLAMMGRYRRQLLLYAAGARREPMPNMDVVLFQGREEDRLLALAGLAASGSGDDIPLLLALREEIDRGQPASRDGGAAPLAAPVGAALWSIASRAGLRGMPEEAPPAADGTKARSRAASAEQWKEWWFRQYFTLACDDRQATLRDPLGRMVQVQAGERLPGGAWVGGANEDGRGTVVLHLGERTLPLRPLEAQGVIGLLGRDL